MPAELLEKIKKLPKLELHIHLEGCIPLTFIERQAALQGIELPRPIDDLYPTHDLSEFLAMLDWVCALVKTRDQAKALALEFGKYCEQEHIIYCEVIVNPTHWKNLHFSELLPALAQGFDTVQNNGGADIRILPSILRQQTKEEALALAQWIVEANEPRIAGVSVDGNEKAAGPSGEKFAPAYQLIREAGLGCTAHAGESSGPQGVISALDELKAQRLDHGVRAIEDDVLTQRLADHQIPLNVCVSSNCHILYDNVHAHPFKALAEKGVLMTLNTDDPVVLKTTLTKELFWVASEFDLSIQDLKRFQENAVKAAFCSEEKKQVLKAILARH